MSFDEDLDREVMLIQVREGGLRFRAYLDEAKSKRKKPTAKNPRPELVQRIILERTVYEGEEGIIGQLQMMQRLAVFVSITPIPVEPDPQMKLKPEGGGES